MKARGDILRVDLTREVVSREPIPPELCQRYLGGEGVNSWLLWEHFLGVNPKIDPVSPENVLIAGIGPLGGLGYGGSKMKWTFKSPAYNMFGDSVCGGGLGAALRWAGHDHLVITGRAGRPVYLFIDNETVEIRDASAIWGRSTAEADDRIKEEMGDPEVQTVAIGPAGENLVRYASLTASRHRGAGRTGGGCVMGSKNLKAVAVRGTRGIAIHDPQAFFRALDALIAAYNTSARTLDGWRTYGTLMITGFYQRLGVNPYRNNQGSMLPPEKYELLGHRWYMENMAAGALTCSPGCISGCGGWYRLRGEGSPGARRYAGELGGKPEYGGVAAFGSLCDIPDLAAVSHLWKRCAEHGLDVVEVGACSGLLMELWQRGIVTGDDLRAWLGEPLRLDWGNYEAVERIIEAVALQQNELGWMLARGVYQAAREIEERKGVPVLPYALYGKGGAAFMEEVRHTPSWAVNMAVASRGADHLKAMGTLDKVNRPDISQLYFGRPDVAEPLNTTLKGANSALAENYTAFINCLGVCMFLVGSDPVLYPPEMYAQALAAATGESMTREELLLAGERTVNLEKAFNSRLGYRREHDALCHRWLKERIPDGVGKGWSAGDYLEQLKEEYYRWHGWDPETSLPTREKLEELGMEDVARVLGREGALA